MPIYQGVSFQVAGDAGWTNVFYLNQANAAAAMTTMQLLNTQMLGIQAASVSTLNLRVSDVTIRGDGLDAAANTPAGALAIVPPDSLAPLNLAQRLLCITADNQHRVNHYIHGMRQSDITTGPDGRTITTNTYRGLLAMTTFSQSLIANTVNWQKRSQPPVTAPISVVDVETLMSTRRVGRPFGLPRGRRRVV